MKHIAHNLNGHHKCISGNAINPGSEKTTVRECRIPVMTNHDDSYLSNLVVHGSVAQVIEMYMSDE